MLGEERRDWQKYQEVTNETKLKGLVQYLKGANRRLLLRSKSTGAWLSVHGTTVSGTVWSATEFSAFSCARYNISTLNLQSHCDGCGTAFGVTHKLSCSTGGLVIPSHKKISDKILYLPQHAFTPALVRAKTIIHHGCTIS